MVQTICPTYSGVDSVAIRDVR